MNNRQPALPAVRAFSLAELPTAYPHLRFAVQATDGHQQGHDAGHRHPLAGTGKLVLACAVARLAAEDPGLLGERITLAGAARESARTGPLRLMRGEPTLTVDDAMSLIVGTGDARCVLAVLDHLQGRSDGSADLVGEARTQVTTLGLRGTEIVGMESASGPSGGEGLTGWTTPQDLCTLLTALPEAVRRWMEAAFEPAGLASALPGFGPRTVEHRTVAGQGLPAGSVSTGPGGPGAPGWASVLVLPGAVVAAHHAAEHPDGTTVTPLEASTALGTLGLAVWQDLRA